MSTTSRLVSGSASAWGGIVVTMLAQLILVPIYLSYWSVQVYGIYVAIQALVLVFTTLDRGHIDYLGYEFLKIGQENPKKISSYLWPGLWITILTGLFELILLFGIAFSSKLFFFLGDQGTFSKNLMWQAGWTLIFQWFSWTFSSNISGLFFRALVPFGYYPRMGWWDLVIRFSTVVIPVFAVMAGANLFEAGLWTTIGLFLISVPRAIDIARLIRKEKIATRSSGAFRLGIKNYWVSLSLSGRYFLESFRQQGIRLVLAPLLGVTGLAAFSTMRTGANVAQQGLLTITQPLLPELMRFLQKKEQDKTDAAFGTVWFVLVGFLTPVFVVFQAIALPLFSIWTKGQITFNPSLFAFLSLSVLVYAFAQPAIAIVVGNNLLKNQVLVSSVSATIAIAGLFIIVPEAGLAGAGFSLLLSEVSAAIIYRFYAKKWLIQNGLDWPINSSKIALVSISIAALGMLIMIAFPKTIVITCIITTMFLVVNAYQYWRNMPNIAVEKAKLVMLRIPLFNAVIK